MQWEVLESEYLFKRPWLTARREHVKLPTGAEIQDFYILEYPDFCNVIAITKEGQFVLERQYRHAQQITGYEIPAGCQGKMRWKAPSANSMKRQVIRAANGNIS